METLTDICMFVVSFITMIKNNPIEFAVFMVFELFPLVFTLIEIAKRLISWQMNKWDKVLTRCVGDTKYKNRIASQLFFFADMGPSISSFSAITIFTTTDENVKTLTWIFFLGIIVKELGRTLKNMFYAGIDKRS